MIECVQSRDALRYRILSSGVVLLEDTVLHPEPVAFVRGLYRKMLRTLSGSKPDMSWRQRRNIWCSMPGSVFVKSVTPAKEGISNQERILAWKMDKESRSLSQSLSKRLSEGEDLCTPVG